MRAESKQRAVGSLLGLIAVGLAAAGQARGQDGIGDPVTLSAPPTLASYDEARYTDEGRRDPFLPLVGNHSSGGPRFDRLRLTGVFLGSAGNSLAVLEESDGRGHFLRLGQELGNVRLVDLFPDGAVFEVREYGSVRRETARLDPQARPPARRQPAETAPPPTQSPSFQTVPPGTPSQPAAEPSETAPPVPGGSR